MAMTNDDISGGCGPPDHLEHVEPVSSLVHEEEQREIAYVHSASYGL